MAPKRAASKAAISKKQTVEKEPVKKSARVAAKNKRLLSDDEPEVDVKKKKVADKVSSKETVTSKRKKATDDTPVEDVEPVVSQPQATKRKRTAASTTVATTSKETKAAKLKKDVNDNEINEEETTEDKPIVSQKGTRGRGRKPAAAAIVDNLNTEEEQPSAPVVAKRGRGRAKKDTVEEVIENKETIEEEIVESQPVKEPVKRGRGRKQETAVNDEQPEEIVAKEQPKKSARGKKKQQTEEDNQITQETVEKVVESKPTTKRGRSKKIVEETTTELSPTETSGRSKSRTKSDEVIESDKPIKKSTRGRKKQQIEGEDEADNLVIDDQQQQKEEIVSEKEEDKHIDEIEQDEQPVKKGRGRQKATTTVVEPVIEEPTTRKVRGRLAKKDQQLEEKANDEIVETLSQPTTSTTTVETEQVTTKRGRRPARKVIENVEMETQSQPTTTSTTTSSTEPPVKKKGRGRVKKVVEPEPVEEPVEEKVNLQEEEDDDNVSEKDLVIDLPPEEEPPKKQQRGRKVKEVEQQVIPSQLDPQQQPKRGRGKKPQQEVLAPSKATSTITSTSNKEDQQIIVNKEDTVINDNQLTTEEEEELPVKRSRHEEIVTPIEQVTESSKKEEPQRLEEIIEKSNEEENENENNKDKAMEIDESQDKFESSQEEEIIEQDDIDKIVEDMKSNIEKSLTEDYSLIEKSTVSSTSENSSSKLVEQSSIVQKKQEEKAPSSQHINKTAIEEDSSSSFNDTTGEVISAKELEETYAELPNTSASSGEFQLTYESIAFKIHPSETQAPSSNSISFTIVEQESSSDHKRAKLYDIRDKLKLPSISNGRIASFGDNEIGELGIGKLNSGRSQPIEIAAKDQFCYVNTLSQHSVCINSNGQLYTFGNNDECALGRSTVLSANNNNQNQNSDEQNSSLNDDNEDALQDAQDELQRKQEQLESTPTICELNKMFKIYKATCGDSHTAVLTTSGTVLYWGNFRDTNGKVGLSVEKLSATLEPEQIDPNLEIVDIASGGNFLLMLDSLGVVYSLGTGDVGQLGRLKAEDCKLNKQNRGLYLKPHPIEFPKDVKINAIWAGEFVGFARSTENKVYSWGLNNYGQLGFQQTGSDSCNEDQCVYRPKEVDYFSKLGNRTIVKIACGQHHSIALDNRGDVYAFGRHDYGRLGLGKLDKDPLQPTMIENFKNIKIVDISCGATCSFAVTEDGKLYSWGMESRQLGLGKDTGDILEPTLVTIKSIDNFKSLKVAAGCNHCLVLGQSTGDPKKDTYNTVKNNGVV